MELVSARRWAVLAGCILTELPSNGRAPNRPGTPRRLGEGEGVFAEDVALEDGEVDLVHAAVAGLG
jgi:hypothetical protein